MRDSWEGRMRTPDIAFSADQRSIKASNGSHSRCTASWLSRVNTWLSTTVTCPVQNLAQLRCPRNKMDKPACYR